ncbi:MAG: carboxypeptidase-like regulatory domain-containing protein, partial [bacterium]
MLATTGVAPARTLRLSSLADTLQGVVVSATDGAGPIQGAQIQWKGTKSGVYSDKAGRFEIARQPKADTLICRAVGFQAAILWVPDETYVRILMR